MQLEQQLEIEGERPIPGKGITATNTTTVYHNNTQQQYTTTINTEHRTNPGNDIVLTWCFFREP